MTYRYDRDDDRGDDDFDREDGIEFADPGGNQDTGGGDGRTVVRIACHNHPRASLIAVAYGPHGYRRPDDEFKTTDEAVAAVIGAWRALS